MSSQRELDDFFSTQEELTSRENESVPEGSAAAEAKKRHRTEVKSESPKKSTPEERPVSKKQKTVAGGQLLDGYKFLFVPTKHSQLIKAKAKAFEGHGAEIYKDLDKGLTHILVGEKWTVRDVLNNLKIDELDHNVTVLRNDFPSDCIEKGKVLDEAPYRVERDKANDSFKERQKKNEERQKNEAEDGANDKATEEQDDTINQAIEDSKLEREAEQFMSDDEDEGDEEKAEKKKDWINFMCMTKNVGSEDELKNSPNYRVIRLLSLMLGHYENERDEWRAQGYRKALNTLKRQTEKITSAKQAQKLPGIGNRIAQKIEEIVQTGHLQRLEEAEHDPRTLVLEKLLKIFGVGTTTAKKWYAEGVRSVEDAEDRKDLTKAQRIGIEHYDDFNERMPRSLVSQHFDIVTKKLATIDRSAEATVMGSYRRGRPDCGDIDIIITKKRAVMEELTPILHELVKQLTDDGFIKCTLTSGKFDEGTKWYGASVVPGDPKWRRLDFLLVPWAQRGAALMYFTGNDLFNRSTRLLARRKGYQLNQKGLFKRRSDGSSHPSDLIEAVDERRIFDLLGIQYREPTERNP